MCGHPRLNACFARSAWLAAGVKPLRASPRCAAPGLLDAKTTQHGPICVTRSLPACPPCGHLLTPLAPALPSAGRGRAAGRRGPRLEHLLLHVCPPHHQQHQHCACSWGGRGGRTGCWGRAAGSCSYCCRANPGPGACCSRSCCCWPRRELWAWGCSSEHLLTWGHLPPLAGGQGYRRVRLCGQHVQLCAGGECWRKTRHVAAPSCVRAMRMLTLAPASSVRLSVLSA